MRVCDVKRRTVEDKNPTRLQSFVFYLKKQYQRVRVCKKFFVATMNLEEWSLYSLVEKANVAVCYGVSKIASQAAIKKSSGSAWM